MAEMSDGASISNILLIIAGVMLLTTLFVVVLVFHKGKAKAYQVKQVLLAVERLEVDHGSEK